MSALKLGCPMHQALRHLLGGTLPRIVGGRFRKGGRHISADRAVALVGAGYARFNINGLGRATGLTITDEGRAALDALAGAST